jgi:hypothetical protein
MENIEKLFKQEVRDKKKIGTNIFSRVSTRKGGSRQALKTPYLYMSTKERKQLNGEVVSYNMNDVMDYKKFKEQPLEEQKRLMLHWRKLHKTQDIQDQMGISRTVFYKVINRLDIPKENTNIKRFDKIILTDDEVEKYSKEFLEYNKYKQLTLEQQAQLLEAYIEDYGGVRAVQREWEGSDEGYLYGVRSRHNKKVEREIEQQKQEEKESRKQEREQRQAVIKVNTASNNDNLEQESDSEINTSDPVEKSQDEQVKDAIDLLTSLGYFDENEDKELVDKTDVKEEVAEEGHNSDININTNSFSFNLNGEYNAKTIKRRLELALEVIEDEDELLNLSISISSRG